MRSAAGVPLGAPIYKVRKIGGQGFVINLAIANNGDKVCGTDVGGAYKWYSGATSWSQLFSSTSLPSGDWDIANGAYASDTRGCFGIMNAPNDSTRIYMGFNGYWYVSSDSGATFTRTALAVKYLLTNSGPERIYNNKLAVDPQNKDVAVLGSSGDGVYVTTDGLATTPTAIASIPAPTVSRKPHLIACDPNSTVVGGQKQIWYASSWGNGVYQSVTGPAGPYALMVGSPLFHLYLICDAAGNVWVIDTTTNRNVFKYNGATWAQNTTCKTGLQFALIAVEPGNTNNIVIAADFGQAQHSTDGGVTWIGSDTWQSIYPGPVGMEVLASQVFALAASPSGNIYWGAFAFDPTQTNVLYGTHGTGVCYSSPPATFIKWTFNDVTQGIEELVGNKVINPLGGPGVPIFGVWDKMMWRDANLDIYPATLRGPSGSGGNFNMTWDIDYSLSDPNFLVSNTVWNGDQRLSYSTDCGITWTKFNQQNPAGSKPGGCIAVGAKGAGGGINVVYLPGNNGTAYYRKSTDLITDAWRVLVFPGYPSGFGNWVNASYTRRYVVTADKTVPGTFYVLVNNENQPSGSPDAAMRGVWKSTDEGETWARVYTNELDTEAASNDAAGGKMMCVPGKTGHLFYTPGQAAFFPTGVLKRSTDGAVSWAAVPNVTACDFFDFGMAVPGGSYPTVFFVGKLSGVYGFYMSVDNCATWLSLGNYPLSRVDSVNGLFGDMTRFGRFYIGYSGTGFIYGDYDYGMRLTP